MTPPDGYRRLLLALIHAVAILCVWVTPGYAAPADGAFPLGSAITGADFNGDHIVDVVDLPRYRHGAIVVQLSGTAPAVLPMVDTVDRITAIDIDHDGDLDLGALTRHHKLLIWMNRGDGRFAAARTHRRRLPTQLARSNTSSASDSSDADPSAAPAPASPVVDLLIPSRWLLPSRSKGRPVSRTAVFASSADYGHPCRGRAPPSLLPAL